eukprot:scaffold228213_cov30-Tisochrysis_lutea.AAC.3
MASAKARREGYVLGRSREDGPRILDVTSVIPDREERWMLASRRQQMKMTTTQRRRKPFISMQVAEMRLAGQLLRGRCHEIDGFGATCSAWPVGAALTRQAAEPVPALDCAPPVAASFFSCGLLAYGFTCSRALSLALYARASRARSLENCSTYWRDWSIDVARPLGRTRGRMLCAVGMASRTLRPAGIPPSTPPVMTPRRKTSAYAADAVGGGDGSDCDVLGWLLVLLPD